MKVITYLGFTVLSIFIQFCVMDFIQEKLTDENHSDKNSPSQKKVVDDFLKNISSKPHALYFRTQQGQSLKRSPVTLPSLPEDIINSTVSPVTSDVTDISTPILDILYDENTSTTEITTVESFFTTEVDNVTEITLFEGKNKSTTPNVTPKISFSKHCECNLLYKVCDVNCCCDQDCTNDEQQYFQCKDQLYEKKQYDGCVTHLFDGNFRYGNSGFDNLFCVVQTNLPQKRNLKTAKLPLISQYNKWKNLKKEHTSFEFKKSLYNQSDPIWILKNGTIYYLDFPRPMINNYCTDRAPMALFRDENISCIVKLKDLEMFHVSRTSEESVVISATDNTFNSSTLNCSNLHCINWTVLVCENDVCMKYNKSLNEPSCTDIECTNLALKIDYIFYFNNLKISNATIKLHVQNISYTVAYMTQEITVKFIMGNKSIDNVLEFSGNPGYINNLPIIISKSKNNFTTNFYNSTAKNNHMILPENNNGMCVLLNSSNNIVRFGVNTRMKCRYFHKQGVTRNNTNTCHNIQDEINRLFGTFQENIVISPLGNPYGINDNDWIKLEIEKNSQESAFGAYNEQLSKLYCYNLNTRVSFNFIFANVNEKDYTAQNKILTAKYEGVASNVSFNTEDISLILTIDIIFVDATKPNLYVYAGSPNLNIHLPKDFFFPFPKNDCICASNFNFITILSLVTLLFY